MVHRKLLLLGLGNPIIGDDGVGIHVVRMLKQIYQRTDMDVKEVNAGGIGLIEEMLGYETVIIIDSYATDSQPGRIREFVPDQFKNTLHMSSPHDTNFFTALQLYKGLDPARTPKRIRIFTIDIEPNDVFSEEMSPPVQEASLKLAERIISEI